MLLRQWIRLLIHCVWCPHHYLCLKVYIQTPRSISRQLGGRLSSILRLARRITNQALHEMSLEYVWDKVILLIDLLWSTSQSVELILSVMEKIWNEARKAKTMTMKLHDARDMRSGQHSRCGRFVSFVWPDDDRIISRQNEWCIDWMANGRLSWVCLDQSRNHKWRYKCLPCKFK